VTGGQSLAQLGVKKDKLITIDNEEGQATKGFLFSMKNLDANMIAGFRVPRVFQEVKAIHGEIYVHPLRQIAKEQGHNWFEFQSSALLQKRPASAKVSARPHLALLANLLPTEDQSPEDTGARASRAEVASAETENESAEAVVADDVLAAFGDAVSEPDGPQHAPAESVYGSLASEPTTASAAGKGGKGKKRRKATEADEEEILHGEGLSIAALAQSDPDMAEVARKHEQLTKKLCTSLWQLDVSVFLQGERLAKALTGVGCCETCCFG
jgi:hypothetical protein